MPRIMSVFVCISIFFPLSFSAIADNRQLERRASAILAGQWKTTAAESLSNRLLTQWKLKKNRKQLFLQYISYFDNVVKEMFSKHGINPSIDYSLRAVAPLYILWAQEEKKEETLSNAVALLICDKTNEAEQILKEILGKPPEDKNARLLAGLSFPKNRNSIFLQKKWKEIEEAPSNQIITVGFPLWSYTNMDRAFLPSIYKLIEENIRIINTTTQEQKEMLLLSYVWDCLEKKPGKESDVSLSRIKKTNLYKTLAPHLKGKILKIIHSETASLVSIEKQKDKKADFRVELKDER